MRELNIYEQIFLEINHGTVSRKHCRIYFNNNNFYVYDNNSTSGTFI
jgi:pSer/pThr/pTyr-binding forkhead associated (FHA) protein